MFVYLCVCLCTVRQTVLVATHTPGLSVLLFLHNFVYRWTLTSPASLMDYLFTFPGGPARHWRAVCRKWVGSELAGAKAGVWSGLGAGDIFRLSAAFASVRAARLRWAISSHCILPLLCIMFNVSFIVCICVLCGFKWFKLINVSGVITWKGVATIGFLKGNNIKPENTRKLKYGRLNLNNCYYPVCQTL